MSLTNFSLSILLVLSLISTLSTAQNNAAVSPPGGAVSSPGGGAGGGSAPSGGGVGAAVELWCVAKNNAEDKALKSAIDWACGPGGADCGPVQPGGPCYDSSDIQKTASWVFNDYFLKHGMNQDACSFDNTAALISINPSHNGCKFPSSKNSSGRFSGSTNVGLGPASQDLSSGSSILRRWIYILMAINVLFASLLIF
ncbi:PLASMODESMATA CALLOSE-BINDING PROTEIN 5-like [Lycium barbarum]|uniref:PLASMODESMATA CALLOSE-BINDING PROTEIN 5-like n=1 Tax=Lycium barbarum TaxID=112863 RepID=UPI00293F5FBD|nr:PLASMODESMATA CALLOSE-BINDING PROTEIN 5-like [Lycium barbarum]